MVIHNRPMKSATRSILTRGEITDTKSLMKFAYADEVDIFFCKLNIQKSTFLHSRNVVI